MKKVIEKTEEHLDRTLDIRNHLRLHSIVLAIVRVLFDTGDNDPAAHLSLLALQRKGKVFDVNDQADAAERLLYSDDDSINSNETTNVEASDGISIQRDIARVKRILQASNLDELTQRLLHGVFPSKITDPLR